VKKISIVTPCYNEEGNVTLLVERVRAVFADLPEYTYEHIFADNKSEDNTLSLLKDMAASDTKIKIIANVTNFGQVRSAFNAIKAANGDAVVLLAADLQDPPELIADFIEKWEEGYQVVYGLRAKREESQLLQATRKAYYRLLKAVSEDQLVSDMGEFCLFDKVVLDVFKSLNDANPYIRGLLSSLGFSHVGVPYSMAQRHAGETTTSLVYLCVYALNGFINHTLLPIRLATILGLLTSSVSFLLALGYLILKLIFWDVSPPGIPTLAVGMFFLGGVQLFMLGFIGELVGAIFRQSKNRPLVIEKERINFDGDE
jgi:polyisoprenyl-phosphate glycosyltransferase